MVFDLVSRSNVSTDALEEVPTLKNYKKLTLSVLFVQLIVSGFYHYARIEGAGIYYLWTYYDYDYAEYYCNKAEYDNTTSAWNDYKCDDYFDEHNDAEKCIRSKNDYVNWINDGCEDSFSSPDVDYYCSWEIYKCDDYFPHIVKDHYYKEDYCKDKNKGDSDDCDDYFDKFDSPNYIYENYNSNTHENWKQACNCKNYAGEFYHRYESKRCTDYSNTSTSICYNNSKHPDLLNDACSCKNYVFDAYTWDAYDCNDYYHNENWYPSDAGISFPWVGGIWFVLAIWTTTLPQTPKICIRYTFISLIINIVADGVNSFYYDGISTGTLVGFSFVLVFPCLAFIRLAFHKLEIDTKEKQLSHLRSMNLNKVQFTKEKMVIDLRAITLNKLQFIIIIALGQLYISFPAYQYELDQIIKEKDEDAESFIELARHLIPTAAGGMLNIVYVVSILFMDITKVHFVDFMKGNFYNLEGFIGSLQFIGLALALVLSRLELPTQDEIVIGSPVNIDIYEDHSHTVHEDYEEGAFKQIDVKLNVYWSTIGCIGLIWIFMTFLAAHVKNNGTNMKYFERRCNKRQTATKLEIRNEIAKSHIIINKDELLNIKQLIIYELDILTKEIKRIISYERNEIRFQNLIQHIQNEIDKASRKLILPEQTLYEFGSPTHFLDIMTQWYIIRNSAIEEPLEALKWNIKEHISKGQQTNLEYLLPQYLDQKWTIIEQKLTMIQENTKKILDVFEINLRRSIMNLRGTIIQNHRVSKDDFNELRQFLKNELQALSKHVNDKLKYDNNLFQDLIQNINKEITTKLNHNILSGPSLDKFIDLASDINIEDQFQTLIKDTIINPWKTLKQDIFNLLEEEEKLYENESHQQQQEESGQYESPQRKVLTSVLAEFKELVKQIDLRVKNEIIKCKNNIFRSFLNLRRNINIADNVNTNIDMRQQANYDSNDNDNEVDDNGNNNNDDNNDIKILDTVNTFIDLQHHENGDNKNDNIHNNMKLEQQINQQKEENESLQPKNTIEFNETISILMDDNRRTSSVGLEQPSGHHGSEVNKSRIENIWLEQDNEEGQGGYETNGNYNKESNEQIHNIELNETISELRDDNRRTSSVGLKQPSCHGIEVNKQTIEKIRLKPYNIGGQAGNETNGNCNKERYEQIHQLQEDNKKLRDDIKKLHQYNKKLEETLDVKMKNLYNVLEKHNIKI